MPAKPTYSDTLLSTARNIVNQLADLWDVPVKVRQATNDQADAFVVDVLRQLLARDDLLQRFAEQLTKDGTPVSIMQCNGCGYTEAYQPTDVSAEEFQADGSATILKMKEHFAKKGWETSWGYDLCPDCVKTKSTKAS